jgi:hypothetical protein
MAARNPIGDSPIRHAVWRAISETGTFQQVAQALKERFAWKGTERNAVARLSQMLNPRDRHQLPADALLDIVRITRRDEISSLLQRELIRTEDSGEKGR